MAAYADGHGEERDAEGHARSFATVSLSRRRWPTAAGEIDIHAPRVNDKREGCCFRRIILPPWARRSPKVTEVLQALNLPGMSTKDFVPRVGRVLRQARRD